MERRAYPLSARNYRQLADTFESESFREQCKTPVRLGLELQLFCGLRNGTSCRANEGWLSPTTEGLNLMVPDEDEGTTDWSPKTQQGTRAVPAPSDFRDHWAGERVDLSFPSELKAWLELEGEIDMTSATMRSWLFRALEETDIQGRERVERVTTLGEHEVPYVICHDLRASWCAQCLRSDVRRTTVRDWGGWENMKMVDRYAKYVGDPGGENRAKF